MVHNWNMVLNLKKLGKKIELKAGTFIPKVEGDFKISKENAKGKEHFVLLKTDHVLNKTSISLFTKKAFESGELIESISKWTDAFKNLEFKLGVSDSHYLTPYPVSRTTKKLKFYEIDDIELVDVQSSFNMKNRLGKIV